MSTSVLKAPGSPQSTLAGVGKYFRFTLRHNLMRYLVWILVVVGMLAFVAVDYKEIFNTPEKLQQFVATLGSSAGMSAMIGHTPVAGTLAGAVWTKLWMTLAMTLAIGMVFQVTKGARADEENGRTELFRSRSFGVHSTLTSVVSGALLLSLVIGLLSALVAHGIGLDPAGTGMTGSVVLGLSFIACGWIGVGVGALTNQLSVSASLANSTGSIIIVAFYVIRMFGDIGNNAVIWLSPIGWAEKMLPWADNNWWLILPVIVLVAVLIAIAFMIESRRDYGSGVLKDRKGRSDAKPLMRRSWGLTLHLYKGSIIGWSIGMMLTGLMIGSVAKSMVNLVKDAPVFGLPQAGGNALQLALLALMLCILAMVSLVLPMQLLTGLRSDEAKGLTESTLAGSISRYKLAFERFIIAVFATAWLLILGGFFMGVSYGASANDMAQVWKMPIEALIYLPGIMAILGITVLLFGITPRATIPVTWGLYGAMYFDVIIGDALKLPKWVTQIMPFTGTPRVPFESFHPAVLGFVAAAAVFVVIGLIGLRKRDVPR